MRYQNAKNTHLMGPLGFLILGTFQVFNRNLAVLSMVGVGTNEDSSVSPQSVLHAASGDLTSSWGIEFVHIRLGECRSRIRSWCSRA